MVAGLPAAPADVTVMVSTYVPNASPVGSRDHRTLPVPVPAAAVKVTHAAAVCVAVHAWLTAPKPVRVTSAESVTVAVLPRTTPLDRLSGVTARANASCTNSVSMTDAGLPPAFVEVTTMVSTYVPAASPVGSRDHRTLPLPVPPAVVKVSHAAAVWVAFHAWVPEPGPVMVTSAESITAVVLPATTVSARLAGVTASTSVAFTVNVMSMVAGLPLTPAAVAVIVSMYVAGASPVGSAVHRSRALPVPLTVVRFSQVAPPVVAVHPVLLAPVPSIFSTAESDTAAPPKSTVGPAVPGATRIETGAVMVALNMLRPCVAATRRPVFGSAARSNTAIRGRPSLNGDQFVPPSVLRYTPRSVPM